MNKTGHERVTGCGVGVSEACSALPYRIGLVREGKRKRDGGVKVVGMLKELKEAVPW